MKLDPTKIIKSINQVLANFSLIRNREKLCIVPYHSVNTYRLQISDVNSEAYNDYGNTGESVKVLNWFSDYWLFIEIIFGSPITEKKKQYFQAINISISIFQGNETDDDKIQLFRAEWDDYGENTSAQHPQPHWHFLSNNHRAVSTNNFEEFLQNQEQSFEDTLIENNTVPINLSKFHFAMIGDWVNSSTHTHSVDDESISKWFSGLFGYLKYELEYIADKR